MSLRLKLIITYIIMIIVSVSIIFFSGMGMISLAIRDSAKTVIGDQTLEEAFGNAVDVIADLRYTEKYHQETLAGDSFAAQLADQVSVFNGFLVVKSNNQYKAYGIKNADQTLYNLIDNSSRHGNSAMPGHGYRNDEIMWNNEDYAILKYDFPKYSEDLTYFFLFKNQNVEKAMRHYNIILLFGLSFLAIIVIGPLLWIVTKDIVLPLKKLENCAQEIAQGNLNFELKSKSGNEIGKVMRSYEKMRFELKKSITNQLDMEENRKQLLSNITHDLKTPITSIKGYIQGIRDGVANEPEKLSKYLDVIYNKADDMNAMIDDLFLFSKLDLKKEPFNKDYVDVNGFYESCIYELHLELDGNGVELTSECSITEGLKALMDSQKIKRVILNIINNSMKFMDKEQKLLNMAFLELDGSLVVKIRDNGIGIDQKELTNIFDRFYRTDPSRNRNTGGSGLGLAIARQIVEQHNGTIAADSVKGAWTEIKFTIPLGNHA